MHLLGRWPCIAIDEIIILPIAEFGLRVTINDDTLSPDETETLFVRDGFRNAPKGMTAVKLARIFWSTNFINDEPFHGQMIHWDFNKPVKERTR
jgi:hypothetical protein